MFAYVVAIFVPIAGASDLALGSIPELENVVL